MIVRRLGRITAPRLPMKDHNLSVGRNVHAEPPFGDRDEPDAGRCVADLRLEPYTLVPQLPEAGFDGAHPAGLSVTVTAPGDDCGCGENEADEDGSDDPPSLYRYAARRHARSRALRARGLRDISSAEAFTALRITSSPRARPPHVHSS